jgi:transposase
VNTISEQVAGGRRRRRVHSDEFKANTVASCQTAGISVAAVAMANGINANLLRRWVREAETRAGALACGLLPAPRPVARTASAAFVPMQLPAPSAAPAIRIELRRGATSVTMSWPSEAADACAAWMRELLR